MNASANRNSQAIHQKHKCNEKQGLEITPRFCRCAVLEHRRTKKYSVNDACHAQASKFSGSVILRAEIYTLWPSQVSPHPVTSLWRPGTARANGNFREEICYFCGAKQPFYHTILWVLVFKQGHLPGTLGLWKHLIFEELRDWQSKETQIHHLHGTIPLTCKKVHNCFQNYAESWQLPSAVCPYCFT